jgi:uncharacterized membrane protein
MARSPDGPIQAMNIPIVRGMTLFLALAGLIISLYFTFAYYGRVKKARWVPQSLCAREGSNCVTVVQTPYARVFGAPNSLLGTVLYLAVGRWLIWALIGATALAVALGFYLIYALRRILHTGCPLCYAAHAINAALLVLLILSAG